MIETGAKEINGLSDVVRLFPIGEMSGSVSEIIYGTACLNPRFLNPHVLSVFGLNTTFKIPNPLCDQYVVRDLIFLGVDFFVKFVSARSPYELCKCVKYVFVCRFQKFAYLSIFQQFI